MLTACDCLWSEEAVAQQIRANIWFCIQLQRVHQSSHLTCVLLVRSLQLIRGGFHAKRSRLQLNHGIAHGTLHQNFAKRRDGLYHRELRPSCLVIKIPFSPTLLASSKNEDSLRVFAVAATKGCEAQIPSVLTQNCDHLLAAAAALMSASPLPRSGPCLAKEHSPSTKTRTARFCMITEFRPERSDLWTAAVFSEHGWPCCCISTSRRALVGLGFIGPFRLQVRFCTIKMSMKQLAVVVSLP